MLTGTLPLISFIYKFLAPAAMIDPYLASSFITGVAFFLIGAVKGGFVFERWYWAGAETFIVAGAAAALAYLVGVVFRGIAIS